MRKTSHSKILKDRIYEHFNISKYIPYIHWSSGMMVYKNLGEEGIHAFYEDWLSISKRLIKCGLNVRFNLFEEVSLALFFMMNKNHCWHLPMRVHNNILGSQPDLKPFPIVLHYHKLNRLERMKIDIKQFT